MALTAAEARAEAAERELAECKARAKKIEDMTAIATSPGNWDYDPYLHGMANALLLAYSVMENLSYKPLEAPAKWLSAKDIPLPPPPQGE